MINIPKEYINILQFSFSYNLLHSLHLLLITLLKKIFFQYQISPPPPSYFYRKRKREKKKVEFSKIKFFLFLLFLLIFHENIILTNKDSLIGLYYLFNLHLFPLFYLIFKKFNISNIEYYYYFANLFISFSFSSYSIFIQKMM